MPLQELIYTSVASTHDEKDVVENILTSSKRNNVVRAVTGLLLFDGHRYIQILEGEAENVDQLYDVITKDPRHQQIELLHKGGIASCAFENWRMAYESMPQGLLKDLAENMAVFSMELGGAPLGEGESFGAKLEVMFMTALAAE